MKKFKFFIVISALLASTVVLAEKPSEYHQELSVNAQEDGSFTGESEIKQVDKDGTSRISKTEQKREVSSDGNVQEVLKDSVLTNPKGMLNEEAMNRKVLSSHNKDGTTKVIVEEKILTKDGTKIERAATARKVINKKGNSETKVTGIEKTDPKGLFNKSEVTVTEMTETRPDGTIIKKKISK